jgi:hypothetical protein
MQMIRQLFSQTASASKEKTHVLDEKEAEWAPWAGLNTEKK